MNNKVTAINQNAKAGRDWMDIEAEFNHHFYTAHSISALLFDADGRLKTDGITPKAEGSISYALGASILDMNKLFDELLRDSNTYLDPVEIDKDREQCRKDEIKETADSLGTVYSAVAEYAIEAINDGTTLEKFNAHALWLIDAALNRESKA